MCPHQKDKGRNRAQTTSVPPSWLDFRRYHTQRIYCANAHIAPVRRNNPRAPFSPATCRGWSSRALPRVLQAVTAPVVFHFDLPVLKNAINGGGSGKVETRVSGHEPAPLAPCGRMHEVPSVRSAWRCLVESLRELVCRDEVRTRAECPARRTQCG